MTRKPRVLVVADYYLPGFRAGGPIRSISNTIGRLAPAVDFFVVTRDHDSDAVKYPGIEAGRWTSVSDAAVYYTPRLTRAVIEARIDETHCDAIWLNSFFSRACLRVLMSRRLHRIHQAVLLAPRGELSPGALALKRWRKRAGIQFLQRTASLQSVDWLASSEREATDIARIIGTAAITSMPESVSAPAAGPLDWPVKRPGRLRAVYASRITPMKNLLFLLDVLAHGAAPVDLDLIGPIDDSSYWARCRQVMARMPAHVSVTYRGEAVHADLMRRLPAYDVLLLPTLGENFGHVIVEAWSAGCPVLVSDRTPWRHLDEQGIGWDRPLERSQWITALEHCVSMADADLRTLRQRAVERARRVWRDGISGDEALRTLIVRIAQGAPSRQADEPLRQDDFVADANACR